MRRRLILVTILAAFALAALAVVPWFHGNGAGLAASGTLEARNINIGSKVGGRITQVLAQEGDHVQTGQLLVTFDDAELWGRLLQARGAYEQAKATYEKMLRGNRPEEILQARAATGLPDGADGFAAAAILQAGSDLERARAEARNADDNFRRADALAREGVVSRQMRDDAEARMKSTRAQVEGMEQALRAAQARLQAARAGTQLAEKGFRAEDIAAAKAALTQAEGLLKEAEARYAEREVRAPADAVIEVMDIRPGDLVAANARIAKLLEAGQLYVMVYVPQGRIGQVKVGQAATVQVDSFPDEKFPALVEQIRQQAEFLPRNVQTAEEREHQVIGVKLRVENREGKLHPGVHADVTFLGEAR
jgi:HlyD family secretion protein